MVPDRLSLLENHGHSRNHQTAWVVAAELEVLQSHLASLAAVIQTRIHLELALVLSLLLNTDRPNRWRAADLLLQLLEPLHQHYRLLDLP